MIDVLGLNAEFLLISLLPIIVLLAAGLIILAFSNYLDKRFCDFNVYLIYILTASSLISSLVLSWLLWPEFGGFLAGTLSIDKFSMISWTLITISTLACLGMYVSRKRTKELFKFENMAIFIFSALSMCILCASNEIITTLVAMVFAVFTFAILFYSEDKTENSSKFIIISALAFAFFVMGTAFVFGSIGTSEYAQIAEKAREISSSPVYSFYMFGIGMILCGFAFFASLFPFHLWSTASIKKISAPVACFTSTAFFSSIFIAMFKFFSSAVIDFDMYWHTIILLISLITLILAPILILAQDGLRGILAFMVLFSGGTLFLLFPSIGQDVSVKRSAMLSYLFLHTAVFCGMYAIYLSIKSGADLQLAQLRKALINRPMIIFSMLVFSLSFCGFPLTFGFFAKFGLISTLANAGSSAVLIVIFVTSAMLLIGLLRPFVYIFIKEGDLTPIEPTEGISRELLAIIVICIAFVLVFGLFPDNFLTLIKSSTL